MAGLSDFFGHALRQSISDLHFLFVDPDDDAAMRQASSNPPG